LQVKMCDPCLSALSVPPWPKKRYINTLPFLSFDVLILDVSIGFRCLACKPTILDSQLAITSVIVHSVMIVQSCIVQSCNFSAAPGDIFQVRQPNASSVTVNPRRASCRPSINERPRFSFPYSSVLSLLSLKTLPRIMPSCSASATSLHVLLCP